VTDAERLERNKNAIELNESYYDFITDHYQEGWGNKFHFYGCQPEKSWEAAKARHEHYLTMVTEIKSDMKMLDLGCNIGGPAREIAIFTECHVTGITINGMQVGRGTAYNEEASLTDRVQLVQSQSETTTRRHWTSPCICLRHWSYNI
jgi:sterol 24-C-methyltransferase